MAKFSGGTFKDGVLSYVYEAKPGGRKNNINIKKIGGDWFFVNKDGSKRTNLANKGKLSKTHIDNLKGAPGSSEENIFASANVSPETGKVSTNVNTAGGIDTTPQGVSDPIQQNTLAESNYSLPQTELPASDAQRNFTPATSDVPIQTRGIIDNAPGVYSAPAQTWEGAAIGPEGQNFEQSWTPGSGSNFSGSSAGSGPGVNAPVIATDPNTSSWSPGVSHSGMPNSMANTNVSSPTGSFGPPGGGDPNMTGTSWSPGVSSPGTSADFAPISPAGPAGAGSPSIINQNTPGMASDATQGSTTPGIPGTKNSSWGAADWSAVGSVMKGVGGLASAYTGMKNYQLARDAFGAQKDQWQADYNQRLKAYEDNKALANQEIDAKNKVLAARGQGSNVIKHI